MRSLRLQNVGPIKNAEVTFGDLTIFVGPQATGKSIFLQFAKLVLDKLYIHEQLHKHGIDWDSDVSQFLDVYLGEGMRGIWQPEAGSSIYVGKNPRPIEQLVKGRIRGRRTQQASFYIPAQRVLSLANGWPRPFQGFSSQDPFAIRDFSETFRLLMEQEFSAEEQVFPKTNRLKKKYRDLLSQYLFGGFGLDIDRHGAQKQLVLRRDKETPSIPFLAWSAGQREFVPLLMGLYWLMPSGAGGRREPIKWVIIEEPEMGLHPRAISVVLLLVLELLWREYRVCISTHSPHVLDIVWGIQKIRQYGADASRLLDMLDAPKTKQLKDVAMSALKRTTRVYYFASDGQSRDISNLDPSSEDSDEASWGGLSEFTGRVNDIVAEVVAGAVPGKRSVNSD